MPVIGGASEEAAVAVAADLQAGRLFGGPVGVVGGADVDLGRTASLAEDMLGVSREMWQGWLTEGAFTSQADELPGLLVPTCYVISGKDGVVDQAKQLDDIRRAPRAVPSCSAITVTSACWRPGRFRPRDRRVSGDRQALGRARLNAPGAAMR